MNNDLAFSIKEFLREAGIVCNKLHTAPAQGIDQLDAKTMADNLTVMAIPVREAIAKQQEPRFMFVWDTPENESQSDFSTLSEMLEANVDDRDICHFVKHAEIGQCYRAGGGAAPLVTTWRVS